jgi:hypothetical protein
MNLKYTGEFMQRFLNKRKAPTEDEDVGSSRQRHDALDDADAPSHSHERDHSLEEELDDAPLDEQDNELDDAPSNEPEHGSGTSTRNSSQAFEEINWEEEIEFDPGKRRSIDEYPPNLKDMVRRKYLANGPCQPRSSHFPTRNIGGKDRRFNPKWFTEHGSWLEYSESTDKAYCFCCFLFRCPNNKEAGYAAFVSDGWCGWNKKIRLKEHVGDVNSVHNQAKKDCDASLQQEQHIYVALNNQSNAMKKAYYTRQIPHYFSLTRKVSLYFC